ncbi:hypothetical protein [Streptomyces sp. H39-S7]|nr:hypothetical protein [Streptomyces sp. H39-S7]MCZ4124145.1 hypothetical protein [Streptomyces sp. H39-S7]
MDAHDRDETCPLQNTVGSCVSAAGEDLIGVRIAADVEEAVGER